MHFRMPTSHLRVAVQRRLGLPLLAAAGSLRQRSAHGKPFDCFGDVAQNDGEAGHQTRHFLVLEELCVVLRSVWGGAVQREPQNYHNYSDTRPDVAAACVGEGGSMFVGDVKLFDAIGSGGVPHGRGAYVAFGNTRPRARALVLGLLRPL